MKILLAIDGSSCSNAAVEDVARRSWPAETEVRIVSAVDPPFAATTEPWNVSAQLCISIQNETVQQARNVVEKAEKRLNNREDKLKISIVTPIGTPKKVILGEARRWGADLIILGSRGHGTTDQFRLGSVSNGIVQNAECSVEVVRQREPRKKYRNNWPQCGRLERVYALSC
jgi:nucleotide-binding universal stress UspA family protein